MRRYLQPDHKPDWQSHSKCGPLPKVIGDKVVQFVIPNTVRG